MVYVKDGLYIYIIFIMTIVRLYVCPSRLLVKRKGPAIYASSLFCDFLHLPGHWINVHQEINKYKLDQLYTSHATTYEIVGSNVHDCRWLLLRSSPFLFRNYC